MWKATKDTSLPSQLNLKKKNCSWIPSWTPYYWAGFCAKQVLWHYSNINSESCWYGEKSSQVKRSRCFCCRFSFGTSSRGETLTHTTFCCSPRADSLLAREEMNTLKKSHGLNVPVTWFSFSFTKGNCLCQVFFLGERTWPVFIFPGSAVIGPDWLRKTCLNKM